MKYRWMLRCGSLWIAAAGVSGAGCGGATPAGDTVERAGLSGFAPMSQAGIASDGETYVAVVVSGTELIAYACDGRRGDWFRGSVFSMPASLTAASGATLSLSSADNHFFGTIEREGLPELSFTLATTTADPLYRVDEHAGGQSWLGGWVLLPDGTQRGLLTGSLGAQSSPRLAGTTVECAVCDQVVTSLRPAAFTPASLGLPTRNVAQRRFSFVAFGDSYASGEGAPVTAGSHNRQSGDVQTTAETWGAGLPHGIESTGVLTAAEIQRQRDVARACHRSDAAGSVRAQQTLQARYRNIQIVHASFACSGAVAENLATTDDFGHLGCEAETDPARRAECRMVSDEGALSGPGGVGTQIAQYQSFRTRFGVRADAAYISVGGNDAGFGKIVEDCVSPVNLRGCNADGSAARAALSSGLTALPSRYTAAAAALSSNGIPPANTFISLYPNPLTRADGTLCSGEDFAALGDPLLRNTHPDEVTFAVNALGRINDAVRAGAGEARWNVIDAHLAASVGHGMCLSNGVRYFNHLPQALETQGRDMLTPIDWVPAMLSFRLSSGVVHPTQEGHRLAYGPAIAAAIDPLVRARFTPAPPTRLRVLSMQAGTSVTIGWDDRSDVESEYRVEGERIDGTGPSSLRNTLGADSLSSVLTGLGTAAWRISVRACLDTGLGNELCSTPVSIVVAARVPTERVTGGAALLLANGSRRIRWNSISDPAHVYFTLEPEGGRPVASMTNPTDLGGASRRVRVATCNFLGCGPATPFFDIPVPPLQQVCSGGLVNGPGGGCVPDSRPQPDPNRLPGL